MHVPWRTKGFQGTTNTEIYAELIDIYRTVVDACSLQVVDENIKGQSLLRLLETNKKKDYASSVIHRCNDRQCRDLKVQEIGFSIRTKRWVSF